MPLNATISTMTARLSPWSSLRTRRVAAACALAPNCVIHMAVQDAISVVKRTLAAMDTAEPRAAAPADKKRSKNKKKGSKNKGHNEL